MCRGVGASAGRSLSRGRPRRIPRRPRPITAMDGRYGSKTTFTRIVAGLAAPDAGRVTIAGSWLLQQASR